jgi:hypothetical protein
MEPRPRRFNAHELKKVGVTLEDTALPLLQCDHYGKEWMPAVQRFFRRPGRRFRQGYWWCPNGCNRPTA